MITKPSTYASTLCTIHLFPSHHHVCYLLDPSMSPFPESFSLIHIIIRGHSVYTLIIPNFPWSFDTLEVFVTLIHPENVISLKHPRRYNQSIYWIKLQKWLFLDIVGFVMSHEQIKIAYACLWSKTFTNCYTSSYHRPRPLALRHLTADWCDHHIES